MERDQLPPTCSYADFGQEFFVAAVTGDRLLEGIRGLAGRPIAFGPIGVGPGRLAQVRADGEVGEAEAERMPGELVRFRVVLPVALAFEIDLGVDTHGFDARLRVPLTLTAVALEGCRIFIDVSPPRPEEVDLDLQAAGVRASLLQRIAGVDNEVRRFVSRYIRKEIGKPEIMAARLVDVPTAIERGWSGPGTDR